jgi:hypothetical protein
MAGIGTLAARIRGRFGKGEGGGPPSWTRTNNLAVIGPSSILLANIFLKLIFVDILLWKY